MKPTDREKLCEELELRARAFQHTHPDTARMAKQAAKQLREDGEEIARLMEYATECPSCGVLMDKFKRANAERDKLKAELRDVKMEVKGVRARADRFEHELNRSIDGDSGAEHCGPCPHNGGWVNGWNEVRRLRAELEESNYLLHEAGVSLDESHAWRERLQEERDKFREGLERINSLRENRDAAITRINELEQENAKLLKSKLSNEAKLRNKQTHIQNQARVIDELETEIKRRKALYEELYQERDALSAKTE